ncbi:ABC transporter ATP-binding protein [Alkaliphilus sp. B6464]|uniref:ABC transporter ATP-binding protein n=1 Tax=Alkaliphilus sp. B6464 TaxID=2731219 RepID=UPI001BA56C6B|nr:ABC transporter ATP-binding protein [Alkaliphilus sp. B6464]QUH18711.1 ABC transporter ATP-binding protein [Alkaliphilus sp. B6464]
MYDIQIKEQKYGELVVLQNMNCNIEEGDFIAIMGESGCGKTTFLNIISGILKDYSGEVYLKDMALHKKTKNQLLNIRRENLGMIFQDFQLIDFLNVEENIRLINDNIKDEEIENILTKLGIEDIKNKTLNQCSGGQKQRVAIARVLAGEKRIILADEPTASLDAKTSEEIMKLFTALHEEGYTIIMITHSPQIASYADRILYLYEGRFQREVNLTGVIQKEKLKQIIQIIGEHYEENLV